MDTSPDQAPGARTDAPGESLQSVLMTDRAGGVPRIVDDARGAPTSNGGLAAGFGLLLTLLAACGLWVGMVFHDGDPQYLAVSAVLALAGVVFPLIGRRAGRASGASGRGPLVCALLGAAVLLGAVVLLAAG
jgi:hypothetical protein